MVKRIRVGAHSCVVNPGLKDAEPSIGDRYGRMFPDFRRSADPGWRPGLPAKRAGDFTMADLLVFTMGSSP